MSPIALVAGLLPVLLFLAGLMLMDSYKLVARSVVLRAIGAGVLVALMAFVANVALLDRAHLSPLTLKRWVAPVLEESLKALYVIVMIRLHRVGFMVDAGIQGFAVGAGFAVVENLYYAQALHEPNPLVWLVRGLGTAVMHGCTTAIFGIVSKDLADRHRSTAPSWFAPGLVIAIVIHAVFNQLAFNPLLSVAIMLVTLPLLLLAVFERSEKATSEWLGVGMDAEVELLEMIHSGEITNTRIGRYLESLKSRFPGPVVADMLCLLQIQLELALRAKGMMVARQVGVEIPIDRDVRANLAEMKFLEKSIGTTGRLAIMPFVRATGRDLWQIHMMMSHGGKES